MHIVFTFPWAPEIPGGGPIDYYQTARYLAAAGAEVTLLPIVSSGRTRFPRPRVSDSLLKEWQKQEVIDPALEVNRIPQNPFHYFLDGRLVKKALLEILTHKRVDVVLGWQHDVAFLPQLLHAKGIVLGMIASNGYYAEWYRNCTHIGRFLRDMMVVRPMRQADVIFARSDFMRKLVIDLFGLDEEQVTVSYCSVNPVFSRAKRRPSNEISNLLYYGCFTHQKGVFDAIAALGKIAAAGNQDWTFKILGWGEREPVQRAANENGIGDKIELLGHLTQSELVRELEWAHLAIFPSYGESFGLSFAEAQTAGLPVVGYAVGGVPEIIENNITGWLVPKGDVEQLAEAIRIAIQNPLKTFEMGLAGQQRANARFSLPETTDAMLRTIEQVKRSKEQKDGSGSTVQSKELSAQF